MRKVISLEPSRHARSWDVDIIQRHWSHRQFNQQHPGQTEPMPNETPNPPAAMDVESRLHPRAPWQRLGKGRIAAEHGEMKQTRATGFRCRGRDRATDARRYGRPTLSMPRSPARRIVDHGPSTPNLARAVRWRNQETEIPWTKSASRLPRRPGRFWKTKYRRAVRNLGNSSNR